MQTLMANVQCHCTVQTAGLLAARGLRCALIYYLAQASSHAAMRPATLLAILPVSGDGIDSSVLIMKGEGACEHVRVRARTR
eukprot:6174768-Pleurochrysis_carterae.AAC.3